MSATPKPVSSSPPAAPGAAFARVERCWICGGGALDAVHRAIFELSAYAEQDPALAAYTGATVALVRCRGCGFAQPEALPALPDFFGRMYDQRWGEGWMEEEFRSGYKDLIFGHVLRGLARRVPAGGRTLLDLGAHVGRLIHLAAGEGWEAEGVELNPRTAAFAARATGLPVHREDLAVLADRGRRWGAVTLVDVLEHVPEPVAALEAVRGVMAAGGWIAVKVPHGKAQLLKETLRGRLFRGYRPTVADNLVHVSHFGPRSLAMALERAGFAEVRVEVAPPETLPGGVAAARRVPANLLRRAAWGLGRAVPGGVRSPLALHLLAYARRAA